MAGNFAVMLRFVEVPGKPELRGKMALSSTSNFSVSGLRLKQSFLMKPGSRIELSVSSGNPPTSFWLRGFIVWARQGASGRESYAGVQLSLESSRDAAVWQKFVEERIKAGPARTHPGDRKFEKDPDSFW